MEYKGRVKNLEKHKNQHENALITVLNKIIEIYH